MVDGQFVFPLDFSWPLFERPTSASCPMESVRQCQLWGTNINTRPFSGLNSLWQDLGQPAFIDLLSPIVRWNVSCAEFWPLFPLTQPGLIWTLDGQYVFVREPCYPSTINQFNGPCYSIQVLTYYLWNTLLYILKKKILYNFRATFSGIFLAFFATGAVASHLLNLLVISAQWLPTTILALLSFIGAFTAFFFPETTGLHSLPEKWENINELRTLPRKSYIQFNLPYFNVLKSIFNFYWYFLAFKKV